MVTGPESFRASCQCGLKFAGTIGAIELRAHMKTVHKFQRTFSRPGWPTYPTPWKAPKRRMPTGKALALYLEAQDTSHQEPRAA